MVTRLGLSAIARGLYSDFSAKEAITLAMTDDGCQKPGLTISIGVGI